MADEFQSRWEQAIFVALEANEDTEKPSSWRALTAAVAQAETRQSEDSWDKTIRTIREEGTSSDRDATAIAKALGVPRSDLPVAKKVTLRTLLVRLEGLEDGVRELLHGQSQIRQTQLDEAESRAEEAGN